MAGSPPSSVSRGYPLGLAGATAATRYVGATASGAPASGTFAVGDLAVSQAGVIYVCTVAGSPGTWTAVGVSGFTEIETQLLGSAGTFDFQSIAGTYQDLVVHWSALATNAGAVSVRIRFNNDSGSNYFTQILQSNAAVPTASEESSQSSGRAGSTARGDTGQAGAGRVLIPAYASTTLKKLWDASGGRFDTTGAAGGISEQDAGLWNDTSAITRVTLFPSAGATFVTGSTATLYGLG